MKMLDRKAIGDHARSCIADFDIRPPDAEASAGSLSGGNQQKMVVAREFSRPVRVLIAAHPTRGLDVGSAGFIHRQIVDHARPGLRRSRGVSGAG
jgi:ABC-type uncharacterized transport system ATPase subunit